MAAGVIGEDDWTTAAVAARSGEVATRSAGCSGVCSVLVRGLVSIGRFNSNWESEIFEFWFNSSLQAKEPHQNGAMLMIFS